MFSLRFLIRRIQEIEDSLLGLRECSVDKGSVSQVKLKKSFPLVCSAVLDSVRILFF